MRIKVWLRQLWRFLNRENIIRLLLIIIIIVVLSSLGIYWLEPDVSFVDALWWSIVTIATVGYGDIAPVTIGGRLIAIIDMFFGIGVLAIFSGSLASILVDRKIRKELGMDSYTFENHIILCEWNSRSRVILHELRLDPKTQDELIVLISDIDRKPIADDNLYFIRGEVSDETLKQANLAKANTVIILGDDELTYTARDAKVILSTLTVESINPAAYTIVELVNEAYVSTCKRANADEIIVSNELNSRLISQAALNHGITKVVSDLLSFQYGNQLYKVPLPKSKIGHSFIDLSIYMKQNYQSIVMAVQKGDEGDVISNPPADYQLEADDHLIVIAPEKPRLRQRR
ncbi:MAG: ion channel [Coleofasciculus sp. B1-GNL1-01]|uniref:potassium channel family protein n=1 Tax=Coleofasciculus sp. B1-GNL1-01 TaxID=3068484 RepID=UPI0032F39678